MSSPKRVRVVELTLPLVNPDEVAKALGAEHFVPVKGAFPLRLPRNKPRSLRELTKEETKLYDIAAVAASSSIEGCLAQVCEMHPYYDEIVGYRRCDPEEYPCLSQFVALEFYRLGK